MYQPDQTPITPDMGAHAIEYAAAGWPVFPLRGKIPAIPSPHPEGDPLRGKCKGQCGLQGHGVIDATTDLTIISDWWRGRYAGCNIGLRPPPMVFALDIDPQHGGHLTIEALQREHGTLPETLTTWTGRGDGSRHLYFRRPPGKLTSTRLPGCDIKDNSGYVVAAPSAHPETGKRYVRVDNPIAEPPRWLIDRIVPAAAPPPPPPRRNRFTAVFGGSIADTFGDNTSWAGILAPHGWKCSDPDPDADGAVWLHPTATSSCSATIRNGCLFVYSTNTPFEITERLHPRGYTKFRAYAVLDHNGDMRAAARTLANPHKD